MSELKLIRRCSSNFKCDNRLNKTDGRHICNSMWKGGCSSFFVEYEHDGLILKPVIKQVKKFKSQRVHSEGYIKKYGKRYCMEKESVTRQ